MNAKPSPAFRSGTEQMKVPWAVSSTWIASRRTSGAPLLVRRGPRDRDQPASDDDDDDEPVLIVEDVAKERLAPSVDVS
jgi:hypothetical protein